MEKTAVKGVQAALSVAAAAFTAYIGALIVPIIVLLVMMLIDYASGMAAAWTEGGLSSKVGARGILKKVGYMALIAVAMGIDYLICTGVANAGVDIPCGMWLGLMVAVWLIINEMISILENLSRLGVPVPSFLRKIIKKLKVSADDTENEKKES